MAKIKVNDEVLVTAGKDRGTRGKVLKIINNKKVVVDGANIVKKHTKATQEQEGGIIEKSAPMDLSNVKIYNPATGKGERVGYKTLDDGTKVRVFKSNGEQIDI